MPLDPPGDGRADYWTTWAGDDLDAALADGQRSFQRFFGSLDVELLPVSPAVAHALRDWDTPEDIGA